jgi:hypothetical protein
MKRDKLIMVFRFGFVACFCLLFSDLFAQKSYTKSGKISFYSKAPLEKIEAVNKTVTAILDSKTGMVQFAVLMKGFEFEKALMQEHFNENYVESDKYPKASFAGVLQGNEKILYTKDGSYQTTVKGKLTLHGVTKDIETAGSVIVTKGIPQLVANFTIELADYKITIPSLVADKISKEVKLMVACSLENVLK